MSFWVTFYLIDVNRSQFINYKMLERKMIYDSVDAISRAAERCWFRSIISAGDRAVCIQNFNFANILENFAILFNPLLLS